MHVGLFPPLSNPLATPEHLERLGRAADERGFSSLWAAEHVVLFDAYESRYPYLESGRFPAAPDRGLLEPFTALSFLAGVTKRIRLGTGVLLVPQRNPVYTAKEATTVDWISGGRFDLGIGIGWLAEEFAVLGVPFAERAARTRDYIEVMRRLWCDEVSEYHGPYYDLAPCRQFPKPVQQPHPPMHFGGESEGALRRVADLGQGWYGYRIGPDETASRVRRLEALLAERGRRRDEVTVSVCPFDRPLDPGAIAAYRDAGVDQLIVYCLLRSTDEIERRLDEIVRDVMTYAS